MIYNIKNKKEVFFAIAIFVVVILICNSGPLIDGAHSENMNDISASQSQNSETYVQEIDLGEYDSEMRVGEKQLLSVTVLPMNEVVPMISYSSSNENVASINGMGRIEAKKEGICDIVITCANISRKIVLIVKEAERDKVPVDIEISDFDKEVAVGKTININAIVIPKEAVDQAINYFSANTSIATINSTGELKGLSPGKVDIILQAGSIKKTIQITVKVPSETIGVNSKYVVLKVGDKYILNAKVYPTLAKQDIIFKTMDESIATVTGNGTIYACNIGNTTVIISNGELSEAVTVIVNEANVKISDNSISFKEVQSISSNEQLIFDIKNNRQTIITAEAYPVISKEILKELYLSKNSLIVNGKNYQIELNGLNITNFDNQLTTDISVEEDKENAKFELNRGSNLPGKIKLSLLNNKRKYLYLYNESKSLYEKISRTTDGYYEIDIAGKYMATDKVIYQNRIPVALYVVSILILLVAAGVYILLKKRHWFW